MAVAFSMRANRALIHGEPPEHPHQHEQPEHHHVAEHHVKQQLLIRPSGAVAAGLNQRVPPRPQVDGTRDERVPDRLRSLRGWPLLMRLAAGTLAGRLRRHSMRAFGIGTGLLRAKVRNPPGRCDLPLLPGGPGHPHLVLGGKATRGADLLVGEQPLAGEAGDLLMDLLAGFDLHAQVVDGPALARVLQQHQLERRIGDGEVGITVLELGRLGVEQLGVEGDRLVEIVDIEGELNADMMTSVPADIELTAECADLDICQCFGRIGRMPKAPPMIDISAPVCCAPVAAGPMSDEAALEVGAAAQGVG